MLQNPCKTLGFKKNIVYKIPPGGGGKPYPASGLFRLHCSRIHPSLKLSTPKVYTCSLVENKRFELLKMNLISPDTLFEICTYIFLKRVRIS